MLITLQRTPAISLRLMAGRMADRGHGELALFLGLSRRLGSGWLLRLGSRRRGFGSRLLGEVVVISHAAADVRVEIPLHRPLGVLSLRLRGFLERRVRP